MERECDSDTNCNWCTRNDLQRLDKGLEELEIGGRAKAIQTTGLLRSTCILRRVLETWEDLLSLIPTALASVRNSQGTIITKSKVSENLVAWGTIQQLRILFPRSGGWQTIQNNEMLSLPDTLKVLLAGFVLMTWSTALESPMFGQPDLVWSWAFLQPEKNFLNHLVNVLKSTAPILFSQQIFILLLSRRYGPVWTRKAYVTELD